MKCIFDFVFVISGGGTLLPPPYGAFPYGPQSAAPPLIPAAATAAPLTPRPAPAPAFGFPPIFYWPYPSPPVSPTSYYTGVPPPQPAATLVIMHGLPYSATMADVLNFFQAFPEVRGTIALSFSITFLLTLLLFLIIAIKQSYIIITILNMHI